MNDYKKSRRVFFKKAAIGSVTITGLSGWGQVLNGTVDKSNCLLSDKVEREFTKYDQAFSKWNIDFDETTTELSLENGIVKLKGKLTFISGEENWSVCNSRDGVPERYAIVDSKGDVQGYLVFLLNGNDLKLLFYHRTAQAFKGVLSFQGDISFLKDAFPCRTQAESEERVLSMASGKSDSKLNDSLYSPEKDVLLQFKSKNLEIKTSEAGHYTFSISGRIEESAESLFCFVVEADYLRRRYVPYYQPLNKDRFEKVPTGWMSWNTYFDKATATDNLNEAKVGAKYLLPFGCEYWSMESWQENSDQLPVSGFYNMDLEVNKKQFPQGMKKVADEIRSLGFRPGLWMAPFGTGNDVFYEKHKNWFLHDERGIPIRSWNGRYTLDPTVKEAREHLREIFHIASHEWGYEFFKVDGMSGRNSSYCAHLYERPEVRARFRDPDCPNPFDLCVKAFRDGIGEDRFFLACQGHSSGPESAYADASRLGADIVHPNEPVRWANVLNQGSCFMNQAFTHNITMIADPDTLLVKDLPIEEARVTATIVALPGQLTFFGDKLTELTTDQMKILQQTLPVADVRPVSLYPYFFMLPVWNLGVNHKQLGKYNVVALFNWEDMPRTIEATAKELGIEELVNYIAYEFWTQKLIEIEKDKPLNLSVKVPPHSVRVLVLHALQENPQWVGSDRHIAQNGMEILGYDWQESRSTVNGSIRLVGGFPLTMRIHVPDGYIYKLINCKHVKCSIKQEAGNILALTFRSEQTVDADFEIVFS